MRVPSTEFSRLETIAIPATTFGAAISVGDESPARSSFLSMAVLGLWGYVKFIANLPKQLFGGTANTRQYTHSNGIGLNGIEAALTATVGYGLANLLHEGNPSPTETASTMCAANGTYLLLKTLANPVARPAPQPLTGNRLYPTTRP